MGNKNIKIRRATEKDFDSLYEIGIKTPEFKVSSGGEFMEKDEFMSAIQNPNGTFLLVESEGKIVGFIYASRQDPERAPEGRWACLVYLVVAPEFRKKGIAQKLYDLCIKELKANGIKRVYGWANAENRRKYYEVHGEKRFRKGT